MAPLGHRVANPALLLSGVTPLGGLGSHPWSRPAESLHRIHPITIIIVIGGYASANPRPQYASVRRRMGQAYWRGLAAEKKNSGAGTLVPTHPAILWPTVVTPLALPPRTSCAFVSSLRHQLCWCRRYAENFQFLHAGGHATPDNTTVTPAHPRFLPPEDNWSEHA